MPLFPQKISTFKATSASYTALPGDTVLGTSGAGGITVTLPPIGVGAGPVVVRKVDSGAGALTVKTADGSTIDGVSGATGVAYATQYTGATFECDGSNWWRTAN